MGRKRKRGVVKHPISNMDLDSFIEHFEGGKKKKKKMVRRRKSQIGGSSFNKVFNSVGFLNTTSTPISKMAVRRETGSKSNCVIS